MKTYWELTGQQQTIDAEKFQEKKNGTEIQQDSITYLFEGIVVQLNWQ